MYVYDNLGSPIALVSEDGTTPATYDYDPFGVPSATGGIANVTIGLPGFAGGLQDEMGWVLKGARYYSPQSGRWTQQDTYDAPLDPLDAHRYAYAGNNPVNYVDPRGNSSQLTAECATAATMGLIAVGQLIAATFVAGPIGFGFAVAGVFGTIAGTEWACREDSFSYP